MQRNLPERFLDLFGAPIYQPSPQWIGTMICLNIAVIYNFTSAEYVVTKEGNTTSLSTETCIHKRPIFSFTIYVIYFNISPAQQISLSVR